MKKGPCLPGYFLGGLLILTIAACLAIITITTNAASGLTAGYAFDEASGSTAVDASGNNIVGTLNNGATRGAGKYGTALVLDGIDDNVNLGNPPILQITGSITISAWIRASAFPIDDAAIVSKRDASSIGYQLDTTVDTGLRTIGFKLSNPSGAKMIRYGTTTLQSNAWYHVAGVYDAGLATLNVYLNGQLDNGGLVGTVSASQANSSMNVYIGRKAGVNGLEFPGSIDDVRVYGRALSQSEIQTDMNTPLAGGGSPPPPDTQPPTIPTNLTASGNLRSAVSLSWAAASDNVAVVGYDVYRSTVSGFSPSANTRIAQVAGLSYADGVAAGTYYYRVLAVDSASNIGPPSNQATGVSLVSNFAGPLRVSSSNPRYFADATGKAIYLAGSHNWSNLKDFGPTDPPARFDFNLYLDFLQNHNHNFFRLWSWELPYSPQNALPAWWHTPFPWLRSGPGLATDGKPKFDLSRLDQTYFDRLRQRVVLAGQRGMYVAVMLFDGYSLQFGRNANDGFPYDGSNNINGISSDGTESQSLSNPAVTAIQEAYVRKVIDTVNDLDNVLYEIANEAGSYSTSWQYHMILVIKQYEASKPQQHPVGMTYQYRGGSDSTLFNSAAEWVSPEAQFITADGSKVLINDTDHSYYWVGLKSDGPDAQRSWAWESFMSGNNLLFMDPYLTPWPDRNSPSGSSPDPYWETLRMALGRTRIYAEKVNLNLAVPRGNLFSTGYGLANAAANNGEYLGYLPSGGSVTIDLSSTPGTLSVEWFNPKDGTTTSGASITGGAPRTLAAPFAGDAVVYLKGSAASSDTIPPSVSITSPANGASVSNVNTITADASDNIGIAGVQFLLDGQNLGSEFTTSPYSLSWDTRGVPNGGHTVSARARDFSGHTNNSVVSINVSNNVDTIPPSVSMTSPANGASVSSVITITADASDNMGIAGVQFLMDGQNLGSEDTSSPYSLSWDTRSGPNGGHTVSARARDLSGNTNVSPVVSINVSNTVSSVPMSAGYAFDEGVGTTAADVSGNNITGILANGATWGTGRSGTALLLDGINDNVDLGNPPILQITGSITISAWIRASAFPIDDAAIVSKRDAGTIGYQLDTTVDTGPRTIGFKLNNPSGAKMMRYGRTGLQSNTWYHVAAVYDAGLATLNVYLNGQLDNGTLVGTVSSSQANSAMNVYIGRRAGGNGREFAGSIDDVRIYGRALSQSEIQTDMNTPLAGGGTPPPPDTQPPTTPTNLTASGNLRSAVSLSWAAASDNVAVVGYDVHRSTASGFSPSANTRIAQVAGRSYTDGVAAGTYYYRVVAVDSAGNMGPPSNQATGVSLSSDTIPPSVSMTSPANGASVSSVITITADASDNMGIAGVQFLMDGQNLGSEDTSSPYSLSWDTRSVANGGHTVSARARDLSGNTNVSTVVSINVSNTVSIPMRAGYPFDEGVGTTAADVSTNNITGTLANGATWGAGRNGTALVLDGTDDYVNLGNPAALQITGSITISAWIRASAFPIDDAPIVSKRDASSIGYQLDTTVDTGRRTIGFKLSDPSGAKMIRYGTTTLQSNTWYHVAGVYDAAQRTLNVYLNGQLDSGSSLGTVSSSQADSGLNVFIGTKAGRTGLEFAGSIDDVRIYSRALTQTEIQLDMNTPLTRAN